MTLILKNVQKVVKFNAVQLEKHVNILRKLFRLSNFDLSVICEDDEYIKNLNRTYRGIDKTTDVLAFPFLEISKPGHLPIIENEEERILGDIVLGIPYIKESCTQNSEELDEILPVMVTHGICHLIGFDHEEENQWKQMYNKEMEILQKFNAATGYNCKPLLGVGH